MPLYRYTCEGGHTFEQVAGYDDDRLVCEKCVDDCTKQHRFPFHMARRAPFYLEGSVIFKGLGFTRSTTPPLRPQPKTIPQEPIEDWKDKMDIYAHETYKYDVEVLPEAKKVVAETKKQLSRGTIA